VARGWPDTQLDYGGDRTVEADAEYAALAAGLALCVRWAAEVERLAHAFGW
jgi:hypothetical protein